MGKGNILVITMILFGITIGQSYGQVGTLSSMFRYVGPETTNKPKPVFQEEPPVPQQQSADTITIPANPTIQSVINKAFSLVGIPYLYGGTTTAGIDCSAFVGMVYRESCAVKLPRTAHDIYGASKKIPDLNTLHPGDLVFFSASGKRISHVGIYLGNNIFIHAASDGPKTGVILSRLSERYWKRTFVGGGSVL